MYLFYIDESGNRDVRHLDQERFYVLTAVGMFEGKWKAFYLEIARAKRAILERIEQEHGIPLDLAVDAEVKSTYLRNPNARSKHPFSQLQTDVERQTLMELFYVQLQERNAVLISVVIDKKAIRPDSKLACQQELHNKAWELLCERIEFYMKEKHDKHTAILITDDVDKKKNLQTTMAHVELYRSGATSGQMLRHIIEMPLFVSSAMCVGVQLADLCCYNIYRRFKDGNPNYPFFKKIEPFFYNSRNTQQNKLDGLKIYPSNSEFAKSGVRLGLSISSHTVAPNCP